MGFFSKSKPLAPVLTQHQQRDRLIEGSLEGVTFAEQMLQQAQVRKAEVIKNCIKEEQFDMQSLQKQMNLTNLRLLHLSNLGGDVSIKEEKEVIKEFEE